MPLQLTPPEGRIFHSYRNQNDMVDRVIVSHKKPCRDVLYKVQSLKLKAYYLLRFSLLNARILRFCESVTLLVRPANGLSPSLNSILIGVPMIFNALR